MTDSKDAKPEARAHRQAAEYIAAEFQGSSLQPAGAQGYLQTIQFRSRKIVEEQSSLALVRNGIAEPVVLGDEATFSMRIEPAPTVEVPIVFVGYGLTVPELPRDNDKISHGIHGSTRNGL